MSENQKLILPEKTSDLTPVQQGWLVLSHTKTTTQAALQAAELAIQGKIFNIEENKVLEDVQLRIKESKELAAEAKKRRLAVTNLIAEKISKPLMEFEKRNDDLIGKAAVHELNLRRIAALEAEKANELTGEEAEMKAHFTSEWFRVGEEHKTMMIAFVQESYKVCLENDFPAKDLKKHIEDLETQIAAIPVPKIVKFERKIVSPERAAVIFSDVPKYDPEANTRQVNIMLHETFALYAQDLKNKAAAIERSNAITEKAIAESAESVAVEEATNVLVAKAEAVQFDAPKIKKVLKPVIEESNVWAMVVIANFVKNWQSCKTHLKVKKWSNLSVSQMADALVKHIELTGVNIPGIKTVESEE